MDGALLKKFLELSGGKKDDFSYNRNRYLIDRIVVSEGMDVNQTSK